MTIDQIKKFIETLPNDLIIKHTNSDGTLGLYNLLLDYYSLSIPLFKEGII